METSFPPVVGGGKDCRVGTVWAESLSSMYTGFGPCLPVLLVSVGPGLQGRLQSPYIEAVHIR